MILGKIKQKQRIVFSLRICFDLVHLLNEFLKVRPAFGDVIVPKMRVVYLNPFQNCNIRYIQLKGNRALERVKNWAIQMKGEKANHISGRKGSELPS